MSRTDDKTNNNKKAMLTALEKSLGVVTSAANSIGLSRTQHYAWLDNDREYRIAVEKIQEMAIDFAESALYKNIQEGKETSTIFFLKTKGKKRGYIERQEIEHSGSIETVDVSKMTPTEKADYIKKRLGTNL